MPDISNLIYIKAVNIYIFTGDQNPPGGTCFTGIEVIKANKHKKLNNDYQINYLKGYLCTLAE